MRKLLLYSTFLLLTQCSKCKDNDPAPKAQLPPATQTGANTFGCLVNGEAWTPQGSDGTSNFSVSYDPGYRYGTLNVATYRITGQGSTEFESIVFYSDSLRSTGIYPLTFPGRQEGTFANYKTGCQFPGRGMHQRRGRLIITRLDLTAGIIAGTFEYTLTKIGNPGCDSVRITQGRFDYKL